jgi:ribosome-binding factor A
MNYRPQRVAELIRQELGMLLLREVEFADALVTITDVTVSKKLDRAEVFVSVLPSERGASAVSQLAHRAGELQHMLLKKLNIRPLPRIAFVLDHGLEEAAKVEKLLLEDNTSG